MTEYSTLDEDGKRLGRHHHHAIISRPAGPGKKTEKLNGSEKPDS